MSAAFDLAPADEAGVVAAVAQARAERAPLAVCGNNGRAGSLRPVQAAARLSVRNLSGVTLYRPQEMVLSALAGTPLPVIEAALDTGRQMLAAEPPDFSDLFGVATPPTLGGLVASNLSGPRRIGVSGALRDQVLGVRAVTGRAEVIRSGGRVHKNVTGLDLCKLLAGSQGTLGILTEVTLKLVPRPEASLTLAIAVPSLAAGVAALAAGLGSPFGTSGAALLPAGGHGLSGPTAVLRMEDFSQFLPHRSGVLRGALAEFGTVTLLEQAASEALWKDIREARLLQAAPDEAVWRLSLRPSSAPAAAGALARAFEARLLLDWGGGLVWVAGPATEAAHQAVMQAAHAAGGTFTLFRAPDPLRLAVPVLPPEPAPLAAIGARVKAALDPDGLLNPGRMGTA
ncbi:FAD-binding oxidoreductase [Pseudoroseomonas deserti]|uniref:FAD-binding oxidoreductase n=1 Tax=Teichococcus deserti TaxID=1817963 RepID=A0A1V2H1D7_9PROT|nr:FAD-binding protein [Pseudoroseomonas deserti]ONG53126.1 FAD-binding oxidoreductase [Pseudoroseomonas deserti]